MTPSQAYKPAHGGYSGTTTGRVSSKVAPSVTIPKRDYGDVRPASVGEDYPLCVVGIGNGDNVRYEIHNLAQGTVCCGDFPDGERFVRKWPRAVNAFEFIARIGSPGYLSTIVPTVWVPEADARKL